jgi:hypothetical protein
MFVKGVLEGSDDTRDDEVAASHTNSAGDENALTAETVHPQDSGDGEKELKAAHDTGGEQGGRGTRETQVVEDEGSKLGVLGWFKHREMGRSGDRNIRIVVDGVDAIPLLEGHDQALSRKIVS